MPTYVVEANNVRNGLSLVRKVAGLKLEHSREVDRASVGSIYIVTLANGLYVEVHVRPAAAVQSAEILSVHP